MRHVTRITQLGWPNNRLHFSWVAKINFPSPPLGTNLIYKYVYNVYNIILDSGLNDDAIFSFKFETMKKHRYLKSFFFQYIIVTKVK